MDGTMPSIWRTHRTLFLIGWGSSLALIIYLVVLLGGQGASGVWAVPVSMMVVAASVLTLGIVVPAWRARRVLGLFAEGIPGQTETDDGRSWDLVLRWKDDPIEVRGATGFLFILWHMKLRLPGESWTFDVGAAPMVVRYVQERFAVRPPVTTDQVHPAPWGLASWLSWGTPPFIAALLALVVELLGVHRHVLPVWISSTLLGYILLLWGRVQSRDALRRLIHGLQGNGLIVDGPHLVEGGPAVRYVLFTNQGPLSVNCAMVGPLAMIEVHLAGTFCRARPAHMDHLVTAVARELGSAPAAPGAS